MLLLCRCLWMSRWSGCGGEWRAPQSHGGSPGLRGTLPCCGRPSASWSSAPSCNLCAPTFAAARSESRSAPVQPARSACAITRLGVCMCSCCMLCLRAFWVRVRFATSSLEQCFRHMLLTGAPCGACRGPCRAALCHMVTFVFRDWSPRCIRGRCEVHAAVRIYVGF